MRFNVNPNENDIKNRVQKSLIDDIDKIEQSKINGFIKLWLYQFYVHSHLSWPFLIYDLDKSFAEDVQRNINMKLKHWAGICRTAENGLLFRTQKNFGLGLTSTLISIKKCS